jgi:hypothetical protein
MIRLGDKVTDSITGFTGIAYGRFTYLTGCDMIRIIARSVENRPPEIFDVDEDRLIASVEDLAMMKEGFDPLKKTKDVELPARNPQGALDREP